MGRHVRCEYMEEAHCMVQLPNSSFVGSWPPLQKVPEAHRQVRSEIHEEVPEQAWSKQILWIQTLEVDRVPWYDWMWDDSKNPPGGICCFGTSTRASPHHQPMHYTRVSLFLKLLLETTFILPRLPCFDLWRLNGLRVRMCMCVSGSLCYLCVCFSHM